MRAVTRLMISYLSDLICEMTLGIVVLASFCQGENPDRKEYIHISADTNSMDTQIQKDQLH